MKHTMKKMGQENMTAGKQSAVGTNPGPRPQTQLWHQLCARSRATYKTLLSSVQCVTLEAGVNGFSDHSTVTL